MKNILEDFVELRRINYSTVSGLVQQNSSHSNHWRHMPLNFSEDWEVLGEKGESC